MPGQGQLSLGYRASSPGPCMQGVPDLTLALRLSCCKALSSSSLSEKLSFLLLITASKLKLTMCQAPSEADDNLMPILQQRRLWLTESK